MNTNKVIGGTARYGNQTYRVYFESGDWAEYGVHADNPARRWMVRKDHSVYGGRAASYSDFPLPEGITTREAAFAAMLTALSAGDF